MFLLFETSCKKQAPPNQTTAAPPLLYDIVDKNGNDILDTAGLPKDSVTITYTVSGFKTQFCDSIYTIYKPGNKIVARDYQMFSLNTKDMAPGTSFDVTYHGNFLGTIHFSSANWVDDWIQATGFTFNNVPVQLAPGSHIYQLQLQ